MAHQILLKKKLKNLKYHKHLQITTQKKKIIKKKKGKTKNNPMLQKYNWRTKPGTPTSRISRQKFSKALDFDIYIN